MKIMKTVKHMKGGLARDADVAAAWAAQRSVNAATDKTSGALEVLSVAVVHRPSPAKPGSHVSVACQPLLHELHCLHVLHVFFVFLAGPGLAETPLVEGTAALNAPTLDHPPHLRTAA